MGRIETVVERERDLTVRTVHGAVSAQEITDAVAEYYDSGFTNRILWDFTDATIRDWSRSDLHAVAQLTTVFTARRLNGRTALVFASTLDYGLGRMFSSLTEATGNPTTFQAFADRAAAIAWLLGP